MNSPGTRRAIPAAPPFSRPPWAASSTAISGKTCSARPHPGEDWHGYGQIEDSYALLDPIKVSVVSPGLNRDGSMAEAGIPAAVVVGCLDAKGIVDEKSTDGRHAGRLARAAGHRAVQQCRRGD